MLPPLAGCRYSWNYRASDQRDRPPAMECYLSSICIGQRDIEYLVRLTPCVYCESLKTQSSSHCASGTSLGVTYAWRDFGSELQIA
ncbi:hypothetical protein J6590_025579 [Homalodisca vitripennis]|nr:hypothetical protein J6590_025579 [Homalodisca vitripennis]